MPYPLVILANCLFYYCNYLTDQFKYMPYLIDIPRFKYRMQEKLVGGAKFHLQLYEYCVKRSLYRESTDVIAIDSRYKTWFYLIINLSGN